jgi:mutator protein MutT
VISGAFNLRVYGIALKNRQVLISSELGGNHAFTKFPGGGLEPGEGLADCLIREMREELQTDVSVGTLFYVNDFFQASTFNENHQLLSFYYFVNYNKCEAIGQEAYQFPLIEDGEKQRWVAISDLTESDFTFPIDKVVMEKLKSSVQ